MAVLFDTLLHPNADLGFEFPSVLQWRLEKKRHIPHLVLGKATPGGAWHVSLYHEMLRHIPVPVLIRLGFYSLKDSFQERMSSEISPHVKLIVYPK